MAFSHVSKKSGVTYWLHLKEVERKSDGGITKLYYFSKDPKGAIDAVPEGRVVMENERTGLPILGSKNKKKAAAKAPAKKKK